MSVRSYMRETYFITLELLLNGFNLKKIAEFRQLKIKTIISHLIKINDTCCLGISQDKLPATVKSPVNLINSCKENNFLLICRILHVKLEYLFNYIIIINQIDDFVPKITKVPQNLYLHIHKRHYDSISFQTWTKKFYEKISSFIPGLQPEEIKKLRDSNRFNITPKKDIVSSTIIPKQITKSPQKPINGGKTKCLPPSPKAFNFVFNNKPSENSNLPTENKINAIPINDHTLVEDNIQRIKKYIDNYTVPNIDGFIIPVDNEDSDDE